MANFDIWMLNNYTGTASNPFHWGNYYDSNTSANPAVRQVDEPVSRKSVEQKNLQEIRRREVMRRGRR